MFFSLCGQEIQSFFFPFSQEPFSEATALLLRHSGLCPLRGHGALLPDGGLSHPLRHVKEPSPPFIVLSPVSLHIKKRKLREERWHSLWFRGYWISEIRLLSLPSVLYRLSYSWHMWHSSPIWWRYFLLPYKNVSFVSPFKQQDMVSRSSLCSSWLLLCYCVFSRNDCVWSNVCLYVLLYIYIWMGGGWLDGWMQHLVIFFLQ